MDSLVYIAGFITVCYCCYAMVIKGDGYALSLVLTALGTIGGYLYAKKRSAAASCEVCEENESI